MTKRNPLGVSPGYHSAKVDVDKIQCDIQTKFPRLWQMLEAYPLSKLRVVSKAVMDADGGKDTSGVYNGRTKTISLNGDAFDIVNAAGDLGFNTWTTDPGVGVPTMPQVSRGDFYSILTCHELGHHFQRFARDDKALAMESLKSFSLHSAMWHLIEKLGVPDNENGDRIGAALKIPSLARVRPIVTTYAATEVQEYFAEDFATYWYYPADLKLIDEVAYSVVDQVVNKVLATKEIAA